MTSFSFNHTEQLNVPLMQKTLDHIEAHPEEWAQGSWRCETGMCFAGTAANIHGATWISKNDSPLCEYVVADPDLDQRNTVAIASELKYWMGGYKPEELGLNPNVSPDARIMEVRDYAQLALGLTADQASNLFCGSNDLDALRRLVAEYTEAANE